MGVKKEISDAARKIVQGVSVVSTAYEGRVNAMTAAWLSRVSFTPPLIMVAVGPARHTHDMIIGSGVFAVNVLGPDNIELGRHFGLKTGRKTDKFEGVEYETRVTGSPVLTECVAWMDCRVHSHHEAGDHTIIVGEILDGAAPGDREPLVYDRDEFFR